jgi:transposase-like protein
VEASAKQLKAFQERDLSEHDFVVLVLDGKTFAEDTMVMALGVTVTGEKVMLGFVQTGTENTQVVGDFLSELVGRGLRTENGLLVVIDGSKGLRAAVKKTFKDKALVQRCQWHKRENVVRYLPKSEQETMRHKLQKAYGKATYAEAKAALQKIDNTLEERNGSASNSLREGLEETLTLHRLGVFELLGRSLKTTNCLESINSLVEERCGKVDCWKNSSQKHRWLASALLDIEPRLNRISGYKHLPVLQEKLKQFLGLNKQSQAA